MPSRVIPFVTGEFYHVFNRGVAQIPIFHGSSDYHRFFKTMVYYQIENPKPRFSFFTPQKTILNPSNKIITIVCYCLMPNHFHFLLQQKRDGGITEFISKLSNSYTKYFNIKDHRNGPLLQGEFKAVHIESNEQLIHLSGYIHLNPLVGYVVKNLDVYKWFSYPEYTGQINSNICDKNIILDQFKSTDAYRQFVLDREDYGRQLEIIKHQLLDYH